MMACSRTLILLSLFTVHSILAKRRLICTAAFSHGANAYCPSGKTYFAEKSRDWEGIRSRDMEDRKMTYSVGSS